MANIAHESFSMLSKYKFDGGWELGGQAVYRSKIYGGTFGANTGTELPSYWRLMPSSRRSTRTGRLYAQNLTNKLYTTRSTAARRPFVAVAPGRAFYLVTRRVLIVLVCVPGVLSKDDVADFRRIMDLDWEDGRSTAERNRPWSSATSSFRRTARPRARSAIGLLSALTAGRIHLGGDPAADLSAAI